MRLKLSILAPKPAPTSAESTPLNNADPRWWRDPGLRRLNMHAVVLLLGSFVWCVCPLSSLPHLRAGGRYRGSTSSRAPVVWLLVIPGQQPPAVDTRELTQAPLAQRVRRQRPQCRPRPPSLPRRHGQPRRQQAGPHLVGHFARVPHRLLSVELGRRPLGPQGSSNRRLVRRRRRGVCPVLCDRRVEVCVPSLPVQRSVRCFVPARAPSRGGLSRARVGSAARARAAALAQATVRPDAPPLLAVFGARILLGFGAAFPLTLGSAHLFELAHPRQAAEFVTFFGAFYWVGAVTAAWCTYGSAFLESNWSWRLPSLLQGLASLIQLASLWFVCVGSFSRPSFPPPGSSAFSRACTDTRTLQARIAALAVRPRPDRRGARDPRDLPRKRRPRRRACPLRDGSVRPVPLL